MVLTTPMVLTLTHGILSDLLNHTHTRGPSVARMRDFFFERLPLANIETIETWNTKLGKATGKLITI